MRVLTLIDSYSLGGAEKQAILFAKYLKDEKKCDVAVWAFNPWDGRARELCETYGLDTKVIGYFNESPA